MVKATGFDSLDALTSATVPSQIRMAEPLQVGEPQSETEQLAKFKKMMSQNVVARSHIGMGYYDTHVPFVILRNILENPGWYTPYTPYQAEISQGRLEMLLNYQTMVADICGMTVANASLLDEGTAAAEAMNMFRKPKKSTFLVSSRCHPQTIACIQTRAEPVDVTVKVMDEKDFDLSDGDVFGALVQYPDTHGTVEDYTALAEKVHSGGAKLVVASDLLALTLLTPPGEWGADAVVGTTQRFGVPMGFGGPHAAFFATTDAFKRKIPGRIVGVSRDSRGKPAIRMAMQTREQHIRRDKATSNICTAQALLANTAVAYAIYHGPEGLTTIAKKVHAMAVTFAAGAASAGLTPPAGQFFDTVLLGTDGKSDAYMAAAEAKGINLRKIDDNNISVAWDETNTADHINELVQILASVSGVSTNFDANTAVEGLDLGFSPSVTRTSPFLTHPVFNLYHSETDMLRYLYSLQSKDLSLATAMIPLGSCTMKLNATAEMIPITWPEVGGIHPFAPAHQTKGYKEMIEDLEKDLCDITGFHAVSLQPNAGAQGEYAGLLAIRAYHRSNGDHHRNICLIPVSAHGTNPASAVMAGMKVVVVACNDEGGIEWSDLVAKTEKHSNELAAIMVTYPSTFGVFDENIRDVCKLIHDHGGQVYMDGANMNAQVGLCSPGGIGADVCHLNLHKTFCIPHGGGGPGMGPIGVAKQLAPFLMTHPIVPTGGDQAVGPVCSAPWSSASILPISYMYIKMMGSSGLKTATELAILNANYMAARLKDYYKVLYTGSNNTCAHEFIIDLRDLKASCNIVEEDVAKRLQDYNFHAPTMSWPVSGTLMIEPTESEPLYELDRLCDALIAIRAEIAEIESGAADKDNNVLKNAPHTADVVISDSWDKPYSREKAAYPLAYLKRSKFWPSVGRLDNVYGDRNVVCSCPPLEDYL
eukprot:CAMPEP_0175091336 /NCGR_PEP_ID=MMETSP0086_2-20121207/1843_1 /TAXON_ID=136419 /ORGANISM="Unknown Unknown, Strain D1" /LENGTH=929 /DNA_ID=CAMNT_0016364061 /DNA_START=190 /DNA_END=2979 /DNA_ORIENTATION=+